MRDLRHHVLTEIKRIDQRLRSTLGMDQPTRTGATDPLLDQRLRLMAARDRGFLVTDRRKLRRRW